MPNASNVVQHQHYKLFVMLLETRQLFEFALEKVYVCSLETCQLLLMLLED